MVNPIFNQAPFRVRTWLGKFIGVEVDESKWGELWKRGILEDFDSGGATDWVEASMVGYWDKFNIKMYSPSLDRIRHRTQSEFYGNSIVD